ncbi:hypothetical protein PHET_00360 [Paragonimus heterotremus]|uniref:Ig-like domain-containing protein n=1 Tax=Paragonimus heterotremus TaxID=100268 RepID=A0A8J4SV76_9TREM|nr:hypothetical protein PHET_00360 [Paragonimus heterotremus]
MTLQVKNPNQGFIRSQGPSSAAQLAQLRQLRRQYASKTTHLTQSDTFQTSFSEWLNQGNSKRTPRSSWDKSELFRKDPESVGVENYFTAIVKAVENSTALLPCRPMKKSGSETGLDELNQGTLLWKRASTNDYLIHDNRRLHPDTRFILDMSSFNQTVMDLRIDNVQRTDEGTYICLFSTGQQVYKRKIELNVLGK